VEGATPGGRDGVEKEDVREEELLSSTSVSRESSETLEVTDSDITASLYDMMIIVSSDGKFRARGE
jgi:hypothetical protein